MFLGYDNPTPMGRGATGGGMAAPVFIDFMEDALEGVPPVEFKVPEGMDLIAVNRKTGMRSNGSGGDVIMEAFKPGTGPSDTFNVIGADEMAGGFGSGQVSQEAEQAIVQGGGGGLF